MATNFEDLVTYVDGEFNGKELVKGEFLINCKPRTHDRFDYDYNDFIIYANENSKTLSMKVALDIHYNIPNMTVAMALAKCIFHQRISFFTMKNETFKEIKQLNQPDDLTEFRYHMIGFNGLDYFLSINEGKFIKYRVQTLYQTEQYVKIGMRNTIGEFKELTFLNSDNYKFFNVTSSYWRTYPQSWFIYNGKESFEFKHM